MGAVLASLMTDTLHFLKDRTADNFLKVSKYGKLTSLSRALRDDPSCQLCSILVKYVLKHELGAIEGNLRIDQVWSLN